MPFLGRNALDDASLFTRATTASGAVTLHAPLIVEGDITATGTIDAPLDLPNNVFLQGSNAAGTADIDIVRVDASNNTQTDAPTGKVHKNTINNVVISSDQLDGTLFALGKTITLTAGANAKAGTVTVNGVTPVAVATTAFLAGSVVMFSLKTVGGTVGQIPHLVTATPATGFTVAATASDTSVYNWAILETV